MISHADLVRLPPFDRRPRHQHRVERFSRDLDLLTRLRTLGAGRDAVAALIGAIASDWSVPAPATTFHRGRSPHTGYCVAPRVTAVARHGEDAVAAWEAANRPWPAHGSLRFGDPTALSTIAHEMGHHLVHALDPPGTPAHGKRWVARFDDAAGAVAEVIGLSSRTQTS